MSRSVSRHPYAVETIFLYQPFGDGSDWEDFLDDLRHNVLRPRYPSLVSCSRWVGREDHIILENAYMEVSVSEYNGVVAVCLATRDPDNGRHNDAAAKRAPGFRKYLHKVFASCAMVSLGSASNGEQFFRPVKAPDGVITSKEGRLW